MAYLPWMAAPLSISFCVAAIGVARKRHWRLPYPTDDNGLILARDVLLLFQAVPIL